MKYIYVCDPDLNTKCLKTDCYKNGGQCHRTFNKEFAAKDMDGKIIVADILKDDKNDRT